MRSSKITHLFFPVCFVLDKILKFTRKVLFHEFCGLIQLFQFYNFHDTWPQFIFHTGQYFTFISFCLQNDHTPTVAYQAQTPTIAQQAEMYNLRTIAERKPTQKFTPSTYNQKKTKKKNKSGSEKRRRCKIKQAQSEKEKENKI